MKYAMLFAAILLISSSSMAQGSVGIGTSNPDSSAILHLSSDTKGVLFPRMTTAQIETISNPAVGLQVYNINDDCMHSFNGDEWMIDCGFKYQGSPYPPSGTDEKKQVGDFDNSIFGRYAATSFVVGGKGYMVAGNSGIHRKDLWMYDDQSDSWIEKDPLPTQFQERFGAISFVIDDVAYVGTGTGSQGNLRDLWKYEATTDSWTELNTFPVDFPRRNSAASFVVNNTAYVGLGYDGDQTAFDDLWKYDVSQDSWTQLNDFPAGFGPRHRVVSFVLKNIAFIGTGVDPQTLRKDLWRYDATNDEWIRMLDFPEGFDARFDGIAFVVDGEAYVGAGASVDNNLRDIWNYNAATDEWTEIVDTTSTLSPRRGGISFDLPNASYIGLGYNFDASIFLSDIWKFNKSNYLLQVNSDGTSEWVNPIEPNQLNITELDPKVGVIDNNYISKWDGTALVSSAIRESEDQQISIGTEESSHLLTLKSDDDKALRIIGPDGEYGHGGKLNFGDADLVFISESKDDEMAIFAKKIGINTLDPEETLSIEAYYAALKVESTGAISAIRQKTKYSDYEWRSNHPYNRLSLYDYNAAQYRFTIDGSGDVSIGEYLPRFKFHIQEAASDLNIDSNYGVGMLITGADTHPRIYLEDKGGDTGSKVMFMEQANGLLSFNSTNDDGTSFVASNILNLSNNGQVGINIGSFNSTHSPKLEVGGGIMAGSFRDRDMGGQFFVDPSALISTRLYGHVFGASFYDINDEDYFVDPAGIASMRAAGSVTATEFIDENNGSYYVNPSSSSLAIRTAGSIQGTRFLDENDPAYFINPSSPTTSINVQGDANFGTPNNGVGMVVYSFSGNGIGLRNVDEGSEWLLYSQSDEDFGLAFDGVYRGQFNHITGAYSWTSDRRLKDDIRSMDTALPKILKLNPRQYLYKSDIDKKQRMGFIAQEVEKIFPELVNPPTDPADELSGYYTLDYSGFGVLAIQAIKEQQAIIDKQSEEINQLKVELKLVQDLEARIKKLEKEE